VLYHLRRHSEFAPEIEARQAALARGERGADGLRALSSQATLDLIASFQHAVVEDLVSRTLAAAEQFAVDSVLVSGGVAANRELRQRFEAEAGKRGLEVFFPSRPLSTDNAAMIAAAAYPKYLAGERADALLNAAPNFPLGVVQ
jgi:N6-L-threonylcarbamoyladenine synthase